MSEDIFRDIVGHERILNLLVRVQDHPSPGYLFSGSEGVGKRAVAECFARLLLKADPSKPLDAHPDFIRIIRQEGKKELVVEQARNLAERLRLSSAYGGRRIAFVEHADQWNEEAANALLKLLEEPPAQAVFLFVTEHPDALPATIRSRLTHLTFTRVLNRVMRPWLLSFCQDVGSVDHALVYASGCPGLAKQYLAQAKEIEARRLQINQTVQKLTHAPVGVVCGLLERMTSELDRADDAEAAWKTWLGHAMTAIRPLFVSDPEKAVRLALGLVRAWQMAHTSLSPRLAIEWSCVSSFSSKRFSSFFTPSYL